MNVLECCGCVNRRSKIQNAEALKTQIESPITQRRKLSRESPVFQQRRKLADLSEIGFVVYCDNILCGAPASDTAFCSLSSTWRRACLRKRYFHFCSDMCWEAWLSNPSSIGGWTSPGSLHSPVISSSPPDIMDLPNLHI